MKKKIAILTQPLGKNYGGIIQNYALQIVLKKMGFDPITINRQKNKEYSKLRLLLFDIKMKRLRRAKPLSEFPKFLTAQERMDVYQNNFKFIKEHIRLTESLDSDNKFYRFFTKNSFDAYIVGSDQTWRPRYSPNIYHYFLDFLYHKPTTSKKIAYASSFGTSDWEYNTQETETVKMLVQQFDAVSVREDSGVDLCKNYLDINSEHVLDPTLLLSVEEYRQLYSNKNLPKGNGVFLYILDSSADKKSIIDKVSDFFNDKVYYIFPKLNFASKNKLFESMQYPSAERWLKSFDDAEFVVTDSFHGTVFSIIYEKPFVTIPNKKRGKARFVSLLRPLGLEHRLIESLQDLNPTLLEENIDFSLVKSRLDVMKEHSVNFLKNNLEE
ncbi:polysaccharide pyruvyl transferase family protein [Kaistella sp.]|uniref:polysaccharide pyruvyl transferase family protein n=1 Tax=Kaistella sp. TaxID=2782235 RepID=UPI0035A105A4